MEGSASIRHLIVASGITGTTVLDGFTVTSSTADFLTGEITINGVPFANTGSDGLPGYGTGGGMVIYDCGGKLAFSRLTIRDNVATYGAGVYSYASGSLFRDCTFSGNQGSGALYVTGSGNTVELEGCRIRGNFGFTGSAIYVKNSSLTMKSTTISGNTSKNAGIVYLQNASLEVKNTLITDNKAAGVFFDSNCHMFFTNVTVAGNWSEWFTGGIDGGSSEIQLIKTIVWGNKSDRNEDNISGQSNMSFTNSLVEGKDLGAGNFPGDTDPGFKDPMPATAAPTTAGDYTVTNPALKGIGYQYK
jgi:hypothetical protein